LSALVKGLLPESKALSTIVKALPKVLSANPAYYWAFFLASSKASFLACFVA
jgi:hypothetical protein